MLKRMVFLQTFGWPLFREHRTFRVKRGRGIGGDPAGLPGAAPADSLATLANQNVGAPMLRFDPRSLAGAKLDAGSNLWVTEG
jgi:hypothetical protein